MREKFCTELETVAAAARRTGIGQKTLRRAIASGALPAYTTGCSWVRIRRAEVNAWIASTRIAPRPSRDPGVRSLVAARLERERQHPHGGAVREAAPGGGPEAAA